MTDVKRLWKRDSQFHPEYKGRKFDRPAHIQETVLIDITKSDSLPTVTRHDVDDSYTIHDIVQWGHIRMSRTQAEMVHFRLGNALREGDRES